MGKSLRWPVGTEVRHKPIAGGAMLYDASRAGNADSSWFDALWWSRRGQVRESTEGRGAALFIEADERQLVLRHYRRGGWMARLMRDRYHWSDESRTRSYLEWHLLYVLRRAGLPVPVPIAACYRRTGRYTYSADLLTEQIPAAPSLAAHLQRAPLAPSGWSAIGRCVRRFHADGVYHADLNAHNVLLGQGDRVWLVDFDRGGLRAPGLWCDSNLVRLRRSIEKVTDTLPLGHFGEADWSALLDAYLALDRSVLAQEPV